MNRTDIIQFIIDKVKAKKYLEIGMGPGTNFHSINCNYKICVDPSPQVPVSFVMTSDDFFDQNNDSFDVIFIDGLHEAKQVYKDITNSLHILNEGGYIICHDMNPYCEIIQKYPQEQDGEWTGDCWKAWVKLKTEKNDLNMYVVDTDYGCGIISRGAQPLLECDDNLTWNLLDSNRKKLLNLISVEEFMALS
jgi:hypothetical protein